jgi:hypothetical protein
MKALFDETIPLVGGHYAYTVVATVVVDDDEARMKEDLHVVTGDRKRGFHWADEGPKARQRMISCLIELGACAHVVVHHPTARRGQERARAAAFEELLPAVLGDGADELVIESRGAKLDARDRAVVMGTLKDLGRTEVSYGWEGKSTPELWLPDAVCGAVGMYLDRSEPDWYVLLCEAQVITEPKYIKGA